MAARRQRGQVLPLFALACIAIIAITGLAVDGGRILVDQRSLQNAADGAALAGALDIGPITTAAASGTAEDDAVYAVEQALSIDFSNNYTPPGWSSTITHHLVNGGCSGIACNSSTSPVGPFNPSNAVSNPCCSSWVDRSGAYTLTIRTPFSFGTGQPQEFINVIVQHRLPLTIASILWPTSTVTASAVARNQPAAGYAVFAYKHNDPADFALSGGATMTVNARSGTNGAVSMSTSSLTFTCVGTPSQYGGDLYTFSTPASNPIKSGSIAQGQCPAGSASQEYTQAYQSAPSFNLPDDPCSPIGAQTCSAVTAPVSVTATAILRPTISAGGQATGPRYSAVTVSGNSAILYLEPGVYFFEGTANNSGLRTSGGGNIETGDCFGITLAGVASPNCNSTSICGQSFALATGGSDTFYCSPGLDFGVLMVFFPAGTDTNVNCSNVYPNSSGNSYCSYQNNTGNMNQFADTSGILYLTSSASYHHVLVWVNPAHGQSSWNFTQSTSLPAGCNTQTCANQIGAGSNVVLLSGASSISIKGAIYAPQDNVALSGSSAGTGYGQLYAYTVQASGSAAIKENYDPQVLGYHPQLVQ